MSWGKVPPPPPATCLQCLEVKVNVWAVPGSLGIKMTEAMLQCFCFCPL